MDLRIGSEVLAPWGNDGWMYPAVVVSVGGGTAHVAFLDGDEADVSAQLCHHGAIAAGTRIQVNWKGRKTYYFGQVVSRLGAALQMAYDDGDKGWATISQCRIRIEDVSKLSAARACPTCGSTLGPGLNG